MLDATLVESLPAATNIGIVASRLGTREATGTDFSNRREPVNDMADTAELAVVLVNYNNEDDTIGCLESVAEQSLDDVLTIVVDNDSGPDSFATVREAFDFPVYLHNETNRGFTGGNNPGIEHALAAGADWILLLNNDTVLDPSFLEEFLASAREQPDDVGILGPKIHTYESDDIWSAGGFVDRWTASTGSLHERGDDVSRPHDVDLVAGAALLVRAELFEDIGLLDDDFFIYYEETEFCARARAAGWRVKYVPVEGIYHKETTEHSYSAFGEYYLIRNRLLYQRKTETTPVLPVFSIYYVLRWILVQTAFLLLVERKPDIASATLKGGLDSLRGKTGKRHEDQLQYG